MRQMQFETRELEQLRFAIRREIDRHDLVLNNMRIEIYEHMARSMVVELKGFIWAETITEPYEYQVPVSPTLRVTSWTGPTHVPSSKWQHIKEMFFPSWLVDIFPVKYTKNPFVVECDKLIPMKTEKLEVRVAYPKLKTALPKEQQVLKVMKTDY